ncbi:MAG: hypothetical protein EU531_01730 [Promethearchaeota archaeon]|nr:MAG: hypothetical protein EU531_01730 [Candidatus Lokiarchaeota archaeon]
MVNQKVYILGNDDMVIMFGLIGIEGMIIDNSEDLITIFEDLISDKSIGMIIITIELNEAQISYFLNFKLNNKRPFVYIIPTIFNEEAEEEVFLKKYKDILEPVNKRG